MRHRLIPRSIVIAWAATIVTAFVVSLPFYAAGLLGDNDPFRWQDLAMIPLAAIMCACVSACVSLCIALVCGMPIFYIWRRLGYRSLTAHFLAGVLLSICALVLLFAVYPFTIILYGQPCITAIAVTIALVAGPVAALTVHRVDMHDLRRVMPRGNR